MTEVTSKPVQVSFDAQDPLPESDWTFRRWFTYVSSAVQAVGVAVLIWAIYQVALSMAALNSVDGLLRVVNHLARLAFYLIVLIATDKILYMIAPSAEQATKMIQTASMFKKGVEFRSKQTATTSPDGATGTTMQEVNTSVPESNDVPASPDPIGGSGSEDRPGAEAPSGRGVDSIPDEPPNSR